MCYFGSWSLVRRGFTTCYDIFLKDSLDLTTVIPLTVCFLNHENYLYGKELLSQSKMWLEQLQ